MPTGARHDGFDDAGPQQRGGLDRDHVGVDDREIGSAPGRDPAAPRGVGASVENARSVPASSYSGQGKARSTRSSPSIAAQFAKIAGSEVQGQAGGGLVTITLSGAGKVTAVNIDPSVVNPDDVETLQDLVVGAFEDATRAMADMVKVHLGPLAQMRQQPQGPTES